MESFTFFKVKFVFTCEWTSALSYDSLFGVPSCYKGFCLICPVLTLGTNCLFFPERERERVFAWVYLQTQQPVLSGIIILSYFSSFPSFVSATQTNFSRPPALIWDNSLSFCHRLVMFDSAAQDFKLAKTFACWARSAATMCCRAATPLDADIDDCAEKIRDGWWLLQDSFMPSPFYTTEREEERERLFFCCLAGHPIVLVPGSRWEITVLLGL